MSQLLTALSFHCGALGAYGINPAAGVRLVVLLNTPVSDNRAGSAPLIGRGHVQERIHRWRCSSGRRPGRCHWLTVMLTGADVLLKPLPSTATAVKA